MPGGSTKQVAAKMSGKPFKLNTMDITKAVGKIAKPFYDKHIAKLLTEAWKLLVEHYPKMTERMLSAVPRCYSLEGTGFTKVTVAHNSPVRG